jgi:hypothetical protein
MPDETLFKKRDDHAALLAASRKDGHNCPTYYSLNDRLHYSLPGKKNQACCAQPSTGFVLGMFQTIPLLPGEKGTLGRETRCHPRWITTRNRHGQLFRCNRYLLLKYHVTLRLVLAGSDAGVTASNKCA